MLALLREPAFAAIFELRIGLGVGNICPFGAVEGDGQQAFSFGFHQLAVDDADIFRLGSPCIELFVTPIGVKVDFAAAIFAAAGAVHRFGLAAAVVTLIAAFAAAAGGEADFDADHFTGVVFFFGHVDAG